MKEKYVIRLRKIYGEKISQQICLKRFNMMLLIIKYYLIKKKYEYFSLKLKQFPNTYTEIFV